MPSQSKPNVNTVWASAGLAVTPDAAKQALGFIAEIPDYDDFNGLIQQISAFLKHVNQEGVPTWDTLTPYFTEGFAKGNGTIYVALQDSTGQALPAAGAANAYWADLMRGARNYVVGGGSANAHTATYVPALPVADGVVVKFKAIAGNTGTATFNAAPILGGGGLALQGGEIALNGLVTLVRHGANWIIAGSSGGSLQVAPALANNQVVVAHQLFGITGLKGVARYTANGSFVVPALVTTIYVSAVGGGAGGGGSGDNNLGNGPTGSCGSGGGAGESRIKFPVSVTPGATLAVVIGAGGAAGAGSVQGSNNATPGGSGGTTSLGGALLALNGGSAGLGGESANASGRNGPSGGAGFPNGGPGADGAAAASGTGWTGRGGDGGSTPFGGGGMGGKSGFTSANATNGGVGYGFGPGGGGGGVVYSTGGNGRNGGAGAPGLMIIEW